MPIKTLVPFEYAKMLKTLSRLKIVGMGLLVGAFFSGCCTLTQLPSDWSLSKKVVGWLWFMSGPFCVFVMGINEITHPFVVSCVLLGFIGMLLLFAHPLRPSRFTAVVSILGLILWFLASFITVIWAVWAD